MNAHRGDVTVWRQRDRVARDDAAVVLDHERHARAAVAALAKEHIGDERAPFEHRPGGFDAPDLDVLVEAGCAKSDREDRHRPRAQRQQLVGDWGPRVVGAIGQQHEPGQRNRLELLARLLDRITDVGFRRVEGQATRSADPFGGRRKAEDANEEFFSERFEQRAVRTPEGVRDPIAGR